MKRSIDLFFSSLGLILLAPLLLLVALLIKLTNRGPIFFREERIGKDFRPFYIYKFRTMITDTPSSGPRITGAHDCRISWLGWFLRKSKLDELPELINVLKGEMSLVGARPELGEYVEVYREDYAQILKLRPGIIDLTSLIYRDEESIVEDKDAEDHYKNIILPEKLRITQEYLRSTSLLYDLKLIFFALLKIVYPGKTMDALIERLSPHRRYIVVGLHIVLFVLANFLAFFIRFEATIPPPRTMLIFFKYLPLVLFFRLVCLFIFSLHRGMWRNASIIDLINILGAVTSSSFMFLVLVSVVLQEHAYPRSIYIIDWFVTLLLLGGIRLTSRFHETIGRRQKGGILRRRLLIIGAGRAADLLLRDIEQNPYYKYRVVGLVDDDPHKKRLLMRGVPILGTRRELDGIMEQKRPDEILIAIPSAQLETLRAMITDMRRYGKPIKILPPMWEVLYGRGSVALSKDGVEPEDLLFRAPVEGDLNAPRRFFGGKRILVTGAGGSIGSELCLQLMHIHPSLLILYEINEGRIRELEHELKKTYPRINIQSIIGDVTDRVYLKKVLADFCPEVIIHAAAYKHVDSMELNPYAAVKVNIFGIRTVAELAQEAGIETFVFISTDKAVEPIGIMGMTKKLSELIVQSLNGHGKTRYLVVRFGNVLESSGSVIPLFKQQIKQGGPVTVTHPEVSRYFMTISEAVHLILHAAAMGRGGEMFVLDMGQPIKIMDLAKDLISQYGYIPGSEIKIEFGELRRGEKLHEALFDKDEQVERTVHPKILRAISQKVEHYRYEDLMNHLVVLEKLVDGEEIRKYLQAILSSKEE